MKGWGSCSSLGLGYPLLWLSTNDGFSQEWICLTYALLHQLYLIRSEMNGFQIQRLFLSIGCGSLEYNFEKKSKAHCERAGMSSNVRVPESHSPSAKHLFWLDEAFKYSKYQWGQKLVYLWPSKTTFYFEV